MLLVGLTGGIGSGKSTVSALLGERGAVVVDADLLTRQLQEPGQPVLKAMVERFGKEILDPNGHLDRPAMAELVFGDPDALADLQAIVWPAVGAETNRRIGAERDTEKVVVLDIPLLVESGRRDLAAVIVVDVDPEVAVDRLVTQRGMSEADARARMKRQADRDARLAAADVVIANEGTQEDLRRRVDEVWTWLQDRKGG